MTGMQAPSESCETIRAGRIVLNHLTLSSSLAEPWSVRRTRWLKVATLVTSIMRLASVVLLAYWLLIFLGTHLPKNAMPSFSASDKIYHCVAFAGLAFLLAWAIPSSRLSLGKIVLLAASIALSYAVLDEWTQQFIPGRTCDVWDAAADSVGVLFGLVTYLIARPVVGRIKWVQRFLISNA